MKNYEEIKAELSRLEVSNYLSKGHVFVVCLYKMESGEISMVISYGMDPERKSWCGYYLTSLEPVLRYCMIAICEYLDNRKTWGSNRGKLIVDIEEDWTGPTTFETAVSEICEASRLKQLDQTTGIKTFVSTEKGDIANFAGQLECEVAQNCMIEIGIMEPVKEGGERK